MDRRSFLRGVVAAPFVITTPGLLMPVKSLWTPSREPLTASEVERLKREYMLRAANRIVNPPIDEAYMRQFRSNVLAEFALWGTVMVEEKPKLRVVPHDEYSLILPPR